MIVRENQKRSTGLAWIEKFAYILDSRFTLPGTKFKFGIDPLIGLVPIIGDLTTFGISCCLILFITRYGVSRKVVILMVGNVFIDTVIGAVPIIGNIFDFTFKANIRNIRLLKEHYEEGKHQGSGTWIILTVLATIFLALTLIIFIFTYLAVLLIEWIASI